MPSAADRYEREAGAVAILVVLVLVLVVLPAGGAGLGLFVRQAAAAELQQAAEAGALAGAARLPLSAQPAALTGIDGELPAGGLGLDPALTARDARVAACIEARRAGSVNDRLSDAFTDGGATLVPGGDCGLAGFTADFPALMDARAGARSFVSARTEVSSLGACLDAATSPLTSTVTTTGNAALGAVDGAAGSGAETVNETTGTVADALNGPLGGTPVPPVVPPVVEPPPLPVVPAAPSLSSLVTPLLPAIARPRLRVVTRHRVAGPLDQLLGRTDPDEQVATAVAERVPKNAVVVPVVAPLPGQVRGDVNLNTPVGTVSNTTTVDLPTVPYEEVTLAAANAQDRVSRALGTAAALVDGQPVTVTGPAGTTTVQFQGVPGSAACATAIRDAQRDFDALVDPQQDTSSVLERAESNEESVVFLFVDPTYATIADVQEICLGNLATGRPDDFEITLSSGDVVPAGQCAAAGSGAFRARLAKA